MVDQLLKFSILKTPAMATGMRAVDRGQYVPDPDFSYIDSPAPLGYGATISAPHMHAYALELLKDHLHPGAAVLDVGSGSGYLAAVFAAIVGRGEGETAGKVVGIDHIPQLVATSIENGKKDPATAALLDSGVLELVVGDGWAGWPAAAPYDAIHVGAAAVRVPAALVEQLRPGGRMVVPVGPEGAEQKLAVVDKAENGSVNRFDAMGVVYVPLTNRERQLRGGG
jgi:protein-L-isoaspartate(D-aspartate) O-methyltransferase